MITNNKELFINQLFDSWKNSQQMEPISNIDQDISINDAYQIQLGVIEKRRALGQRVVGKKIGITSKPVMELLGVNQPDYGNLMSDMGYSSGDSLNIKNFCQPKAEGEIAFILKKDLYGPDVTHKMVLDATEFISPAIEIVDSRIKNWEIKIQDTVADNASSGAYILGTQKVSPSSVDMVACRMQFMKNRNVVGRGTGAATLGNPLNAVTWLANKMSHIDSGLEAGDVILSGSLSVMLPVEPGDEISIKIEDMGEGVSCSFY